MPAPTIEIWSFPAPPGKVGSGLLYLLMAREKAFLRKPGSEVDRVLSLMERRGGADAAIVFDHILTDQEISSLEKEFGLRFFRVDGKVQTVSTVYSVVVPWEQIAAVARLPYVKIIDTSSWPPPALAR